MEARFLKTKYIFLAARGSVEHFMTNLATLQGGAISITYSRGLKC